MFLGIELRADSLVTLVVDEAGRVISHAAQKGTDAPAAAAAARMAIGTHSVRSGGLVAREAGTEDVRSLASSVAKSISVQLNDVVTPGAAVALAEHWCGAARGHQNAVVLTAGEGVHAGIIVDGRLLTGTHGMAGSAGWLALNPVEREDYRRLGCLEAEIGQAGIVRRLVWRIKSGDESRALEMAGGNLAAITAQHVFDAARQGDGVSISVVRDTAKYIGMAVANLVAIVDPEIVILGGLIASAGDLLLESSCTELSRRIRGAADRPNVVPAALGEHGAAIGGARAAMLAAA